jgi:hypothetical protein
MKTYDQLMNLFESANAILLRGDKKLLIRDASEPSICGALMLHLHDLMLEDGGYVGYYTDLEYNRNIGNPNHMKKVYLRDDRRERRIKCDLLIHSRGENVRQDNLLALEMKKEYRRKYEKQSDRERLMALTLNSYGGQRRSEVSLPEYVCGYIIGIYYELDLPHNRCWIEYFQNGQSMQVYEISLIDGVRRNLERLPWQNKS